MFWRGEQNGICWHYTVGGPTDEDWARYCELIQGTIDRILSGERLALMSILYRSGWPSKSQRTIARTIFERIKDHPGAVYAFVSDNRLQAVTLRAFRAVRGPIKSEKAFTHPRPAIRWLVEQGFPITVEALGAEARRQIPSEHLWEELFRVDTLPL